MPVTVADHNFWGWRFACRGASALCSTTISRIGFGVWHSSSLYFQKAESARSGYGLLLRYKTVHTHLVRVMAFQFIAIADAWR